MAFVAISLSIVAFGIWAAQVDFFNVAQDVPSKYFEIALAIFFLFIVPAVIFLIGLIKIVKKPGCYFTGVRVTSKGVEIGTLDMNPVSAKKIWENQFTANDVLGEWKQKKIINNQAMSILIILREKRELAKRFLLERVVFSSEEKCLLQLFGHNSTGTRWNNLVALSQGSLYLLGNDNGIYPDDLLLFREQTADIVSRWKPSFVLTCTLKTIPSLVNLDNVYAFGVLGGISPPGAGSIHDPESQEKIFDSCNNEKNPSIDINQD